MVEEKKRGGTSLFFSLFSDRYEIDPVNKSIPIPLQRGSRYPAPVYSVNPGDGRS